MMDDKNELLEEYDAESKIEHNLDFRFLMLVYMTIFVAFLVILPKIYIKNQIYYMSRDINKLYSEYSILSEENRVLKQNLENMRFKNQILDTMYIE
jgi:cell division protein FtsL